LVPRTEEQLCAFDDLMVAASRMGVVG